MKLVTYTPQSGGTAYVGALRGEQVFPLATTDSLLDVITQSKIPAVTDNPFDLENITIQAPLRPGKIIAVGRNYAKHAAETGSAVPEKPLLFAKYPTCVIGTGEQVSWSESVTQQVDWEGELAIVIGKPARYIAEADAMNYVFGYTVGNDITARDLQASESQWVRAKAQDTFLPLGPCIVTRDEIPDPQALTIQTFVNDERMQHGDTGDMVFNVAYLVAYCSQTFTLEPGDIILTGTPDGVGKGMTPPRFLKDGDVVRVTIEGIGTIENSCKVVKP